MSDQPHDFQPVLWECVVCGVKFDQEFHKPNDVEGFDDSVCDDCLESYFIQCESCDGYPQKSDIGRDGICPLCEGAVGQDSMEAS